MFYKTLKSMQERPALFSCENVADLHIYILGYEHALWSFQITDEEFNYFKENFTDFVKNYHKMKIHHPNWASIISFYSSSNKASIDNFFELFNKFIEKQERKKS